MLSNQSTSTQNSNFKNVYAPFIPLSIQKITLNKENAHDKDPKTGTRTKGSSLADRLIIPGINHIIFEYLNYGVAKDNHHATLSLLVLYINLVTRQATIAANYILCGNADAALALVQKNPEILFPIVESKDPHGNIVCGPLLRIAAMTGDTNFRERNEEKMQEDYGIVEKLIKCYPPEEEMMITEHLETKDWENETEKRMRPYYRAVIKLFDELKAVKATQGEELQNECKPIIERYKESLRPDHRTIIRSGFIFDFRIFDAAIELFANNFNDLGGWNSKKSELFLLKGIGSLQRRACACDLQIIRTAGAHLIMANIKDPDRSLLNFSQGYPKDLSGLGDSFSLSSYDGIYISGGGSGELFNLQNLCRAKISVFVNLINKFYTSKISKVSDNTQSKTEMLSKQGLFKLKTIINSFEPTSKKSNASVDEPRMKPKDNQNCCLPTQRPENQTKSRCSIM